MKGRRWTAEQKLAIVLEGLKGDLPIAELEGALGEWIPWYNAYYPHSCLGYQSPQMVREAWTPCKLAA